MHRTVIASSYGMIVMTIVANILFLGNLYHEITTLELDVKSDLEEFKVCMEIISRKKIRRTLSRRKNLNTNLD